ncbi:lactate utilization protein [Tissierella sp. MB52-C2]|uniref:lactate utilization protein n=1 Tax=Tissierella sp. MB52-C2 TaxID=3070999 RepID=UPI00280ABB22|nr:lactate utilization protein [Tissierella sp. MB52-C2]WMM23780.1 lactate utilization protein [Tissierella sp. MB52-C2]
MVELIKTTLDNLKRNNMQGYFLENNEELFPLLDKLILQGSTIGSGDSVTLEQLGVFDFIKNRNYIFYDKHVEKLTSIEKKEIYIKNFSADNFITGCNAITADGKLVNIDGNGSRVAPMIYGPSQVIVIVGKNKIVENINDAIERVRQIAAPLDAKRLDKETPCTKLGRCIDCKHPQRICNSFVVIARQFDRERIKVIIMNEELGY